MSRDIIESEFKRGGKGQFLPIDDYLFSPVSCIHADNFRHFLTLKHHAAEFL